MVSVGKVGLFLKSLLLALAISSAPSFSFDVPDCDVTTPSPPRPGDLEYALSNTINSLNRFCPQRDGPQGRRWVYNTTSLATVSSSVNYNLSQVCVLRQISSSSTALIVLNTYLTTLPDRGNLSFTIDNYTVVFDYGRSGVHLFNHSSNSVSLVEGQSIQLELFTYGQGFTLNTNIVKLTPGGGQEPVNNNTFSGISSFPNTLCNENKQGIRPGLVRMDINNVELSDAGTYMITVGSLSASITISVSPAITPSPTSSISPTSSSDSTILSSSSSLTSPAVTLTITSNPSSTNRTVDPATGALVLYGFLVVLGIALIAVVIILIIMTVYCIRKCRKRQRQTMAEPRYANSVTPGGFSGGSGSEAEEGGPTPSTEQKTRASSTSSMNKHTCNSGRHSSTSSVQSVTKKEDYIAVYCSKRHAHIAGILMENLKGKCKCISVTSEDELMECLEDSFCKEIDIFAEPHDEVMRAVISRSFSDRSKLKWYQFVKDDKTPHNVIQVEGCSIIQIECTPETFTFDAYRRAMLKVEYPPISQVNGIIPEKREKGLEESTENSPRGRSYSERSNGHMTEETHQNRGQDMTDSGKTVELLEKQLEEQKKTNKFLKVIVSEKEKSNQLSEKHLQVSEDQKKLQQASLRLHEQQAVQEEDPVEVDSTV